MRGEDAKVEKINFQDDKKQLNQKTNINIIVLSIQEFNTIND